MVALPKALHSLLKNETPGVRECDELAKQLEQRTSEAFAVARALADQARDIDHAMAMLESLAEYHKRLALYLMIGLYDVASDALAHDVCDAIELSLFHEGSPPIRAFLVSVLSDADCPISDKANEWLGAFPWAGP